MRVRLFAFVLAGFAACTSNRDAVEQSQSNAEANPESASNLDSESKKQSYLEPIPGKEGFYYVPDSPGGYIDARGYPKDSEVKSPHTGTIFLVP